MLNNQKLDNQQDLISIIMPCFNAEHYLHESINCVLSQTYSNFELLIVDDGSTDSSRNILSNLSKSDHRLILSHQQNCGPFPARNLALQHARGKFVAFLDADDYWAPDCLEKLHRALTEATADLSYCGWQNVVENGQDGPLYVPPAYEQGNIHEDFLKSCPWPIHAALTRRTIVDKVGFFRPAALARWIMISGFDFQLLLKILSGYLKCWHFIAGIIMGRYRQLNGGKFWMVGVSRRILLHKTLY